MNFMPRCQRDILTEFPGIGEDRSRCSLSASRDDRAILSINPFEGDRDVDARLLSDKMVTARYSHDCNICGGSAAAGTRVRARREIYEGRGATFYFCAACCAAMARSWDDDGEELEARYRLRRAQGAALSGAGRT